MLGIVDVITFPDREIARYYAHWADRMETRGKKPETYGFLCSAAGSMSGLSLAAACEMYANVLTLWRNYSAIGEGVALRSPFLVSIDHVAKIVRFPSALMATTLTALTIGNIGYEVGGNPEFDFTLWLGVKAAGFFGLMSSMYIRTRDPKLLDRAPLHDRIAETVKRYLAPAPTTVPVQTYAPLEQRVICPVRHNL